MDVKTTFLCGDLKEEIYEEQPEGFVVKKKEHLVCKLKKSLYGLKQAPRQWYKKVDLFMMGHDFLRTKVDPCVYFKKYSTDSFVMLLLYVDDILIAVQDAKLQKKLSSVFYTKDLGGVK